MEMRTGRITPCGKPILKKQADCCALDLCWSSNRWRANASLASPGHGEKLSTGTSSSSFCLRPCKALVCRNRVFSRLEEQTASVGSTSKRSAYSIVSRIRGVLVAVIPRLH